MPRRHFSTDCYADREPGSSSHDPPFSANAGALALQGHATRPPPSWKTPDGTQGEARKASPKYR